ncbi:MAG: AEC family transporter, partial [Clostridia bacterium]|nr:AEC family transporter [Clostridia bacterium]
VLFTVGLFFLSALLIVKNDEKKRQGMMRFCMVFSNNGFLGLPLAKAVFGESPIVTYVIILNIITNILMFTLGVYLISGDKNTISLKKAFLNPVLLAFIAGIGLNLLDIKAYVPEVATFSTHFSNIVTPISMTILGIKMAGVKFGALFTGWRMYFVSGMKLVVFPALGVGILFALKLALTIDENMTIGFFIALAMPTAGLASTFSDQHDGDTQNAVVFTLGTTILSVLTIPVLYWLICLLF